MVSDGRLLLPFMLEAERKDPLDEDEDEDEEEDELDVVAVLKLESVSESESAWLLSVGREV